ncbi:MAG: DUF45 domain-containing protein [Nitrosopumilus sp.]|nr:DUF45 domain-containing protein [Nitrosopumilus sp.]
MVDRRDVKILSPIKKTDSQLEQLVKKNSKWIYQKKILAKQESSEKLSFVDGAKLPHLGKRYPLKIVKCRGMENFGLKNGRLVAQVTKNTKSRIKKLYSG